MRRLKILIVLFLAAGCLLTSAAVEAQNALERLVMPGELISGHAKLEQDCANCHVPFTRAAQDDLCIKCHKPVAADLREKRGMHGLRPDVAGQSCRHCHADHKGRGADIIQLDKQTFDHTQTNFKLAGKHSSTACDSCHAAGKKFREAPHQCIDCHKPKDVHGGQLGKECSDCHTSEAWAKLKPFDHKATKFTLTGVHAEISCKACHAGERYKNLPVACISCHRNQDKHTGKNGEACDSCHKTTAWWDVAFDHDKNTKFPLLGKHADTACNKCHVQAPTRVKLSTACLPCHAKDDVHKEKLGKECLSCHGEGSWKKDTKFDHALSRFPLRGKHGDAKCDDCHKTKLYRDTPVTCSPCHSKKDKESHDGRLGPNCGQCHNVSEWKGAKFNHDTATKFRLTGQHAKTGCYACHKARNVQKATLATDCYSCHKSRDQHRGAFGRDCGKCHTTESFGVAFIRK